MNREHLDAGKMLANNLFDFFNAYSDGKCSRDKALEDISTMVYEYCQKRPIVGYVQSGTIKQILHEIISTRKINAEKTYTFDCKIHQNEMASAERVFSQL